MAARQKGNETVEESREERKIVCQRKAAKKKERRNWRHWT